MSRIIVALVLFLLTGSVFAAPADISNLVHTTFAPPATDYSVAYLSQIFGTVGTVLDGTSGQILGKIFGIFNKGVMVVAALWLGYTTIQVALKASQEGSFMGQNRNISVMMLRIALGFSLIIPSSATGYSMLQDIFMKIVIEGVGLADQTWNTALNYIQYGGRLYIPPTTLNTSTDMINSAVSNIQPSQPISGQQPAPLSPVSQIFQNEVCMIESAKWQQENQQQVQGSQGGGGTSVTLSSNAVSSPYHPVFNGSHTSTGLMDTVYFPGVGNTPGSFNPATDKATCGTATSYYTTMVDTKTQGAPTSPPYSTNQIAAMQSYSWQALKQLTNSLLPAAQLYVDQMAGQTPTDAVMSEFNSDIFAAIVAYSNLITPYQNMMTSGATDNSTSFVNDAEAQGWIMAGRFFWDVEQANNASAGESISQLFPKTVTTPAALSITLTPQPVTYLYNAATTIAGTSVSNALAALWLEYIGTQQSNIAVNSNGSITTGSTGNSMTNNMIGKMASALHTINFSALSWGSDYTGPYNPIVVLMQEGNKMLSAVVGVWIAAIILSFSAGLVMGICSGTQPGETALNAIMTWLKTLVGVICAALLVPGAILAYYIPLYPFLVFTFAAIGWFLTVIEGMAAAPLICMGMTHPAGEEFLGRAEQSLMLFLSVFLRPALMIVGLIASMIVSFVAFKMMLVGFGGIFNDLSNASGSAYGNIFLSLLSLCVVLVIFGFITMEIIEQCYKLIYQLPNNIMSWIGVQATPGSGDYGQMAKGVGGAVSGTASSVQSSGIIGSGIAKSEEKSQAAGEKAAGKSDTDINV